MTSAGIISPDLLALLTGVVLTQVALPLFYESKMGTNCHRLTHPVFFCIFTPPITARWLTQSHLKSFTSSIYFAWNIPLWLLFQISMTGTLMALHIFSSQVTGHWGGCADPPRTRPNLQQNLSVLPTPLRLWEKVLGKGARAGRPSKLVK